MNAARWTGVAFLAVTLVAAFSPMYRPNVDVSIREHHLLHAGVIAGAAVAGILLAGSVALAGRGIAWLLLSVGAPLGAMLLMWPSHYSPLERDPIAHVGEHVGLAASGFLAGYAGQRFAKGVGVAMGLSLCAMTLLAAWGFGTSPPLRVVATRAASSPHALASGNLMRGHALFEQNCAACHGAQAQGGMGPSLRGESSRKTLRQAVEWIENPAAPMPKLYPETLSAQDVQDVATYVESLR